MLLALLQPREKMLAHEENNQLFERLALMELMKSMPFGAVWDCYCIRNDVPVGHDYITEIQQYEKEVLSKRA